MCQIAYTKTSVHNIFNQSNPMNCTILWAATKKLKTGYHNYFPSWLPKGDLRNFFGLFWVMLILLLLLVLLLILLLSLLFMLYLFSCKLRPCCYKTWATLKHDILEKNVTLSRKTYNYCCFGFSQLPVFPHVLLVLCLKWSHTV